MIVPPRHRKRNNLCKIHVHSVEASPDINSLQKAALCNSILTERICRGEYIQIKISHFKNMERKLLCNSHTSARENRLQEREEKPFWGSYSWESLGTLFFRILRNAMICCYFSVKQECCSWKSVYVKIEKMRSSGAAWLLQDPKSWAQIHKMGIIPGGKKQRFKEPALQDHGC